MQLSSRERNLLNAIINNKKGTSNPRPQSAPTNPGKKGDRSRALGDDGIGGYDTCPRSLYFNPDTGRCVNRRPNLLQFGRCKENLVFSSSAYKGRGACVKRRRGVVINRQTRARQSPTMVVPPPSTNNNNILVTQLLASEQQLKQDIALRKAEIQVLKRGRNNDQAAVATLQSELSNAKAGLGKVVKELSKAKRNVENRNEQLVTVKAGLERKVREATVVNTTVEKLTDQIKQLQQVRQETDAKYSKAQNLVFDSIEKEYTRLPEEERENVELKWYDLVGVKEEDVHSTVFDRLRLLRASSLVVDVKRDGAFQKLLSKSLTRQTARFDPKKTPSITNFQAEKKLALNIVFKKSTKPSDDHAGALQKEQEKHTVLINKIQLLQQQLNASKIEMNNKVAELNHITRIETGRMREQATKLNLQLKETRQKLIGSETQIKKLSDHLASLRPPIFQFTAGKHGQRATRKARKTITTTGKRKLGKIGDRRQVKKARYETKNLQQLSNQHGGDEIPTYGYSPPEKVIINPPPQQRTRKPSQRQQEAQSGGPGASLYKTKQGRVAKTKTKKTGEVSAARSGRQRVKSRKQMEANETNRIIKQMGM